jgi:hypothetical protein
VSSFGCKRYSENALACSVGGEVGTGSSMVALLSASEVTILLRVMAMEIRADLPNANFDSGGIENQDPKLTGEAFESQNDEGAVELQVMNWGDWQRCVLDTIQTDFHGVLDRVEWDDIDWDAWRPLFEQGASATDAVRSAFGKMA